jgi:hypothetical protein
MKLRFPRPTQDHLAGAIILVLVIGLIVVLRTLVQP